MMTIFGQQKGAPFPFAPNGEFDSSSKITVSNFSFRQREAPTVPPEEFCLIAALIADTVSQGVLIALDGVLSWALLGVKEPFKYREEHPKVARRRVR